MYQKKYLKIYLNSIDNIFCIIYNIENQIRRCLNMYIFGKYGVECDEYDMDNIADIFKDMYLSLVGTTEEELKEELEREGFTVRKIDE